MRVSGETMADRKISRLVDASGVFVGTHKATGLLAAPLESRKAIT